MAMEKMFRIFTVVCAFAIAGFVFAMPATVRAEVLNDDELGSIEIVDISVIENAAGIFTPVGLAFNFARGGTLNPGDDLMIQYRGLNDTYISLLDYSPDRKVKPLMMNEHVLLTDGDIERETWWTVGDSLGKEYIMMIVTNLPLTDEELETISLAPDEVTLEGKIVCVAVNDFRVIGPGRDPGMYNSIDGTPVETLSLEDIGGQPLNQWDGVTRLTLSDFGGYSIYPLNTYPYNPWGYMYLYPYPRIKPITYMDRYSFFSNVYYIIPSGPEIRTNFLNYATTGWLDDGVIVIPPGGYWEGSFEVGDMYRDYYLRVLPYLIRENTSWQQLQIQINGTLVQSNIDFSNAIGFGDYYTYNPFGYYNAQLFMRPGNNTLRIYWPQTEEENLELQLVDIVPSDMVDSEIDEAAADEVLVDTETPAETPAE
ncbi:MAG: hypothetical protein NTY09_12615 [bacterium]|nr:hypothetical protein [bacterium]